VSEIGRSAVQELTSADKFNAPGLLKIVAGRWAYWLQTAAVLCGILQGTGVIVIIIVINKELKTEIEGMWDVKTKVIPVLGGATRNILNHSHNT
jgi:hypothetical protein